MPLGRHPLATWMRRFSRDESGVISVQNLFLTIATCCVGASAADVTHFYAARSQLQVSADIAGHAALFTRNRGHMTATQAKAAAVAAVDVGMPESAYGEVIDEADITFGTWNIETEAFTVDASSKSAVRVFTGREDERANAVGTFFFRIVGLDNVDVQTASVFITYQPTCLTEGFSANDVVDVQSNGGYYKGFCMHGNGHVELNQNNYFEDGTVVSMPDLTELVIPDDGLAQNDGLEDALREDFYHIHILDRVAATATADDPLYTALQAPGDDDRPAYLTSGTVVDLGTGTNVTYNSMSAFTSGSVHTRTCTGASNVLTLDGPSTGVTLANMVLLTNCQVKISGKVNLENVVIFTTNTNDSSIQVSTAGGASNSGLWLGKADACATGGGAQIITRGGFKNSAALYMNGGQIIAVKDVNLAANVTGVGASIISGDDIDGSSHISMTGCNTGMENNFTVPYFRAAY
jgi:hypothetical protein